MTLNRVREHFGTPISILMIATLLIVPAILGAGDAIGQTVILPSDEVDYFRGVFFAEGPLAEQIPEIRDYLMMDTENEDPQVVQIVSDFRARLIDAIVARDPDFMAGFANAMQSGDPYVIDAAIGDGAEMTLNAIRAMPEIVALRAQLQADPDLATTMVEDMAGTAELADASVLLELIGILAENETSNPRLGEHTENFTSVVVVLVAVAAVAAATYITVAHAVSVVFTVALAAVIARWIAAWVPKSKNRLNSFGSLQREQLVNAIANL